MKIAISTDTLIKREYTTSIIEAILTIYEDAEIYTLVHKPKEILGPVEMRKIHSSFLSSMFQDTAAEVLEDKIFKKGYLLPTAAGKLSIPCNVDVLINVSSGLSHGYNVCEGVYQISYLVDDKLNSRTPKTLIEKLFRPYLRSWRKKSLKHANEIWTASELSIDHPKVSELPLFIKLEDYPLFPDSQIKFFPKDFVTIDAAFITLTQAKKVIEQLEKDGIKYRFVGHDEHLSSLKKSENDMRFFGERCSGEFAPLLAASRAHLTFQASGFPVKAIQSMSTGVPVIIFNKSNSKVFLKDEFTKYISNVSEIKNFWSDLNNIDRRKCHNYVNRYHEIKFKSEVKRRVDRLMLNKVEVV